METSQFDPSKVPGANPAPTAFENSLGQPLTKVILLIIVLVAIVWGWPKWKENRQAHQAEIVQTTPAQQPQVQVITPSVQSPQVTESPQPKPAVQDDPWANFKKKE